MVAVATDSVDDPVSNLLKGVEDRGVLFRYFFHNSINNSGWEQIFLQSDIEIVDILMKSLPCIITFICSIY